LQGILHLFSILLITEFAQDFQISFKGQIAGQNEAPPGLPCVLPTFGPLLRGAPPPPPKTPPGLAFSPQKEAKIAVYKLNLGGGHCFTGEKLPFISEKVSHSTANSSSLFTD